MNRTLQLIKRDIVNLSQWLLEIEMTELETTVVLLFLVKMLLRPLTRPSLKINTSNLHQRGTAILMYGTIQSVLLMVEKKKEVFALQ